MMNIMQMLQGSVGIALGITLGGYLLMYVTAMVIMHSRLYKKLLKYMLRMTVELQNEVIRLIEQEELKEHLSSRKARREISGSFVFYTKELIEHED